MEIQSKLVSLLDGSADRATKRLSSLTARKGKLATCHSQEGDRLAQNPMEFT